MIDDFGRYWQADELLVDCIAVLAGSPCVRVLAAIGCSEPCIDVKTAGALEANRVLEQFLLLFVMMHRFAKYI